IEEPAPRTVWILCSPSTQDMLPTILSRCRHLALRTPSPDAIADAFAAEGVDRDRARAAAQAAQGHIGRTRALLLDRAAAAPRTQRDALDRALIDIAAFYRDVLAQQFDPSGAAALGLVHQDHAPQTRAIAAGSTPATTLRRIEAVLEARRAIAANVAPLLAVE